MPALLTPILRIPGRGRLLWTPDQGEALLPGGLMFASHLEAAVRRHGKITEVLDLGSGLVTTAGVNFMADDWFDNSTDISTFQHSAVGTGTTAAAIGDTVLVTPQGSRISGTKTNPTANILRVVALHPFTSTLAITEWGLFSATTGGTLWDRRVFTAINVVNGDSIEFTYNLTFTAGG
jgi:hypothetical protein